ncbi:MAG TPA: M23 family metallopeptidase [Bdellovibrionota bacterium]|nr:M23 family metallopeptidase [Bdellovibrionota bacterium]
MNVQCESCRQSFETPVTEVGRIEYARCKNVFRVRYRFRTPCPHCKQIIQLTPHGSHSALGIPCSIATDEPTEAFNAPPPAISPDDPTLPRTLMPELPNSPPPKVNIKTPEEPPKNLRFRLIESFKGRPAPVHVALRPRKRPPFPFLKILLLVIISVSTILTIGLTILAFQSGKDKAEVIPATPGPEIPPPRENIRPSNPLPQGGPENDSDVVDDSPPPKPVKPTIKSIPGKKTAALYIPKIEKVTSSYGLRRDPFNEDLKFHGGIDIAADDRSEVKAALDGRVTYVGPKGGYGNVVILDHKDGYETLYGHLAKSLVKEGAKIKQGDLLGLVGTTGRTTGPHLHFELRKDGRKVDPLRAKLMARKS